MQRQPHGVRRFVAGTGALLLGLALVGFGVGLTLAPAAHAGSGGTGGGGGGGDTKYVFKVKHQAILASYKVVAADGCTFTEVDITAGQDISRQLPSPSTAFGPAVFAIVTRGDECTGETFFAGAGTTETLRLTIANSLNSAQLAATIPITSFEAPPDSPPAFEVTIPNLTFAATGPAVHTVQTRHINMQGANLVEHLDAVTSPATTTGTVTIGDYATASTADLLNGEIDNYHSGTTSVSKT
jgi:hypothetical protein